MRQAIVTLKKGEGRLLKSGGAWIFDNEIDSIMGEFENGDIVIVHDFDGYGMGRGFINMNSKIRIRMMTRKQDQEIDHAFLEMRVRDAWEYRKILDPPAFTKSRKTIKNATKGYREINMRGMKLVKPGGYLATCSCSHFMDYELFTKTIHQAAQNVHKRVRQVEYRTQAPDHPILWSAEESYYLKFYVFQIVDEK